MKQNNSSTKQLFTIKSKFIFRIFFILIFFPYYLFKFFTSASFRTRITQAGKWAIAFLRRTFKVGEKCRDGFKITEGHTSQQMQEMVLS